MEKNIYEDNVNAKAVIILKERLEWLMDNGATKIDGEFHFAFNEVPTAKIEADLVLVDLKRSE